MRREPAPTSAFVSCLLLGLIACSTASPAPVVAPKAVPMTPAAVVAPPETDCSAQFGRPASMTLDRALLRKNGANPASLAKLDASAHRYSRLLAIQMAARTCLEFHDVRWRLPAIPIHGDAHLEQFASTPSTFGLEDFDEAGLGPAVVDLVRFATSIQLACREVTFKCDADKAVDVFFKAYRESIDHEVDRTVPEVAKRLRGRVPHDNAGWLAWATGLIEPLTPDAEDAAKKRWASYISSIGDQERDKPKNFYDIVRIGRLKMGVGSGLEPKLLFRVHGKSDSPDDDLILEARPASLPNTSSCTYRPPFGGALYMLTFISLLGSRMPDAFGSVILDSAPGAHEFWVQRWEPGYTELALSDIGSQEELEELGVDAARQLAGFFWTRFPETLRRHHRLAGLLAFDLTEQRARALAVTLAKETVEGWQSFRAAK